MTTSVFASAVEAYHRAGWPAILPVPPEAKWPPPVGYTGEHGADTTPQQLAAWAANGLGDHSIALRMPDGVIGIDVDDYVKGGVTKTGLATLAAKVAEWGPLPPTWCSTARGTDEGPVHGGILFFRVPPGRYATVLGPDVEIIQRHHRYAVVAPSFNPDADQRYGWYRRAVLNQAPFGIPADVGDVPCAADLPWAPAAWAEGLRAGATEAGPAAADHASGHYLLAVLTHDGRDPCADVVDALGQTDIKLSATDAGARHDTMTARVHRLVLLGASGHPGLGRALDRLRQQWLDLTAGEAREAEFDRMLLSSARKAVTAVGPVPVDRDPCLMLGGFTVAAPAPVDDRSHDDSDQAPLPAPIGEPVPYSWRHVIGTHPFDPAVDMDQTLAAEVLARVWPMLRHASDTKNGWLQRGPTQWELHGDLTRRAVAEVAGLMPKGDPDLPSSKANYTPANRQAVRRARFHTNAPAAAVAGAMRAVVLGGWHPSAVRLADLDSDPEVLWAGGMPYDLRASIDGPTFAQVELNTPHLVSAGVAPDLRPTPHWDALLAAVWPDAEIRAWALRVLSITLTGHPDAALPILLGPGGSGKTSTIELIMSVLGSYAHAANVKLLSGEASHDSIVFALKGRRLSFIDEGPREGRWAQERLKQLTGGAALTGNAMNQNPITFKPTHTLVLTANTEPTLTDEAIRRRVRLIPCEGDPGQVRAARAALTPRIWAAEAPGVLAALMREAAAWLADPDSALTSAAPATIRDRAVEIAAKQDPVRRWVDEACESYEPGTRSRQLFAGFVGWCRDGNIASARIPTETAWGTALNDLGFPITKRRDANYRHLRVRPDSDFDPAPTADPRVDGSWRAGGAFKSAPSTPDHPSPTVIRSPSVEGVEGLLPMKAGTRTEPLDNGHETSQRKGCEYDAPPSTPVAPNGHLPGNTPDLTPSTHPGPPPHQLEPAKTSRSVTDSEVAGRPSAAPISKAEARVQLKAEQRLAAIREAAGETLPLPAVVDRHGNVLPLTVGQVRDVVRAALGRSGALTVDVETSGYPVGHADYELRSVQLGDAMAAVVLHPVDHADEIRALLDTAPVLHAHSATADLGPLVHAGLIDADSAWDRMHDTVIPAKLADPQSTGSDPGLKQLAQVVLGDAAVAPAAEAGRDALFKAGRWLKEPKVDTPVERSGWAQVETGSMTMLRYAASDVLDTAALARTLPPADPAVRERERAVQRMTARVALHGVRIDGEHVGGLLAKHTPERLAAAQRVQAFGIDNPGSDRQVAAALTNLGAQLPRTAPSKQHPHGQPSVAEGVLDPLVRQHPEGSPVHALVTALLEYRHHNTAISTFLQPYQQLIRRGDGRARPTVYTLGADTGRMACVRPNLQQVPRRGGFRACITADPGQLLVSADFAGVELRVAAALSGDTDLRTMLDEGRDLHWEIARQVFGPDAAKTDRYAAKRIVFGRLYGGGVPTLARQAGVSESVAASAVDVLDAMTPGLSAWARQIRDAVRAGRTQFPTYSGRVIHLPPAFPHKAPNFCIQGSARELLVDALLKWRDTRWGSAVLLPVHDEIVVAVPEADATDATTALVAAMETDLFGVPIQAEASAPFFAWADSA